MKNITGGLKRVYDFDLDGDGILASRRTINKLRGLRVQGDMRRHNTGTVGRARLTRHLAAAWGWIAAVLHMHHSGFIHLHAGFGGKHQHVQAAEYRNNYETFKPHGKHT
jgi:hypothetical protein